MKQIFVSSTFTDMHIERDLIQTKISPDLNEKAYQNRIEGINFQDLRWGIDTSIEDEQARDKKILEVCLDEIENNRPYFMVLVGDRYGWIPENDLVKETGVRYGIYDKDEKIEKSITNLEVDYGFLKNPQYAKYSFAYIRNIVGDVRGTIYEQDPKEKQKIEELKAEIRAILPAENIHEYDVVYKDGYLLGTEKFVDFAKKDMEQILFEEENINVFLTDNQKEIIYHKTQADEKSVISNARKCIENKLVNEIKNNNIITIKGASGSGKSTLMASLSDRIVKENYCIVLFSSLTPRTTSASGVMQIITEYINEILKYEKNFIDFDQILNGRKDLISKLDLDEDFSTDELIYEIVLRQYLQHGKREVIILIDAIDQLDNAQDIADLIRPINFSENSKVKFIISYLDEASSDDYIFLNDYLNFKLGELEDIDKLAVIDASLANNNKELAFDIKKEILKKEGSSSPLYISLLVQRLLMMNREDYLSILYTGDSYEKIIRYQKDLIKKMPNDLEELVLDIISQASNNLKANTDDIEETASYIAVSRRGLRESDLKKTYELTGKNYNSLDFATLKKYLRSFFLEDKYLRIDFTHKIIRQAILTAISDQEKINYHNNIARAFMTLPIEDPIKLQEQYYSAYKSDNVDAAVDLLQKIGENAQNLNPKDIDIAIESISKIHNTRLKDKDSQWIKSIFSQFIKFDLEKQKIVLAYFVYSSFEENTKDSLEASKVNGKKILDYLSILLKLYPNDQDIMKLYSAQSTFLGMRYDTASSKDIKRSESYLLEAICLYEKLYDLDKNLASKENLANAYSNIGRFYLDLPVDKREESRSYYQKSLQIFEEIAKDEPSLANKENLALAYNNIANFYSAGDYQDVINAKFYYKQAIALIETFLNDHENINLKKILAFANISMASLYFSEDRFNKAKDWYYKSIVVIRDIEHIEPSLENKENLAKAYNNIGDLFASPLIDDGLKAENFYLKAIRIFESILDHKQILSTKRSLAISYNNIAKLYADWKTDQAYKYYEKSIKLKEDLINIEAARKDIIDLAISYNNLGFLYVDKREDDDYAIYCYQKSVDLIKSLEKNGIDKASRENFATIYSNLACLYFEKNEMDTSNKYYEYATNIYNDLLNEYQDDGIIEKLIIIYNNAACNWLDLGYSLDGIESLYLKVIDLIKKIKDPYRKYEKTAIAYNNLGNLYLIKGGSYSICEDCYLNSIELIRWLIEKNNSTENQERLVVSYSNLAELYTLWGKYEKAKEYLYLAIKGSELKEYKSKGENINRIIYKHKNF